MSARVRRALAVVLALGEARHLSLRGGADFLSPAPAASWIAARVAAVALGLVVAFGRGRRARTVAAVLLAAVALGVAARLGPLADSDDAFAPSLCFWVLLLPSGARAREENPFDARLPLLAAYLAVSTGLFGRLALPMPARFACFAAPALLVAPVRDGRRLAALALGYVAGATALATHALLFSGALLVVAAGLAFAKRSSGTNRVSLETSAALAAAWVAFLVLHVGALALGAPSVVGSTRALLGSVGVAPPAPPPSRALGRSYDRAEQLEGDALARP